LRDTCDNIERKRNDSNLQDGESNAEVVGAGHSWSLLWEFKHHLITFVAHRKHILHRHAHSSVQFSYRIYVPCSFIITISKMYGCFSFQLGEELSFVLHFPWQGLTSLNRSPVRSKLLICVENWNFNVSRTNLEDIQVCSQCLDPVISCFVDNESSRTKVTQRLRLIIKIILIVKVF